MSAIGLRRLGFIIAAFVLQTAVLRAALPGLDDAPTRPSLAGQLLVAAPQMGDPHFERTVILIVEHGPGGAVRIVINEPIGEQPLGSLWKAAGGEARQRPIVRLGEPLGRAAFYAPIAARDRDFLTAADAAARSDRFACASLRLSRSAALAPARSNSLNANQGGGLKSRGEPRQVSKS
jgi:hypothetical protein